jgi:hypothetical protein
VNYHNWLTQLKTYLYTKDLWECICINPPTSIFGAPATSTEKQLEQVSPSTSPLTGFYFKAEDNEDNNILSSEAVKALGEKEGNCLQKHLWKCKEEKQYLQ